MANNKAERINFYSPSEDLDLPQSGFLKAKYFVACKFENFDHCDEMILDKWRNVIKLT